VVLDTAVWGLAVVVMLLQNCTHFIIAVGGVSRIVCRRLMVVM
jgi:hypothetical protein